jgi:hypothetical protein
MQRLFVNDNTNRDAITSYARGLCLVFRVLLLWTAILYYYQHSTNANKTHHLHPNVPLRYKAIDYYHTHRWLNVPFCMIEANPWMLKNPRINVNESRIC